MIMPTRHVRGTQEAQALAIGPDHTSPRWIAGSGIVVLRRKVRDQFGPDADVELGRDLARGLEGWLNSAMVERYVETTTGGIRTTAGEIAKLKIPPMAAIAAMGRTNNHRDGRGVADQLQAHVSANVYAAMRTMEQTRCTIDALRRSRRTGSPKLREPTTAMVMLACKRMRRGNRRPPTGRRSELPIRNVGEVLIDEIRKRCGRALSRTSDTQITTHTTPCRG